MDASNGITTEMRELAAAATLPPAGRQLVTAIITANLRFSGNPHRRGTFMQQGNKKGTPMGSMYALADQTMYHPTMCKPGVTVHIVHDLGNRTHRRLNVTYHGFPSVPWRPPDVQRFVLYAQLLRRIEWDCAFAIDLSDVVMLNVPPCHALPRRLVIGSDAEAPWFRTWLNKAARINGLRGNVSIPLRAYLNGSRPALHLNVGVLGGCRAALVPLLDRVVRKFETHWSTSFKRNLSAASDMVLWNDLGAELSEESTPPLTGYPYGPVNMPMYGGSNPGSCLARYFRNSTGRHTNPCRTRWFNEAQQHGQRAVLVVPQLGSFASSESACWLWLAARRAQGERPGHLAPSHCLDRATASF